MKVAIAGFGVEGRSSYEYYVRQGYAPVIVDEREKLDDLPDGSETILGADAFSKLQDFDLVIRTAGLSPAKIHTDGKIWSATNEFFAKCTVPIIGVTGTKGKGTTASLIDSILRASGHRTVFVGNIGRPALDMLNEANRLDAVVYELSSFQLWDLEKSPQVAVVLMIEPDHLDVHADMDDYINAKANIRRFQKKGDVCFYHPTNRYAAQIVGLNTEARTQKYNDPTDDGSICVQNGWFMTGDGCQMLSIDTLQLPGVHNLENACAAIMAAYEFTWNWSEIEQGLRQFTGLPHRLKFVREIADVKYYDDSIATTPGSAIAALKSFTQPKVIILGGSSKGADFTELAEVAANENIRQAILIGEEAPNIEMAFQARNIPIINLGQDVTMTDIVNSAHGAAKSGDIVILSPSCASFGMFNSYSDRGDQFIAAVELLQ